MWAVWTTAAKIERGREFGLSWGEIEGQIDLDDSETHFAEGRHTWPAWQEQIDQNPDLVAVSQQLLDEERASNWC